jgi:hypothetical protein
MNPCVRCGGEAKLEVSLWHAIKANRMPAFGRNFCIVCQSCKCRTRARDTEELAVKEWEEEAYGFPDRGFF